MSQQIEMRFDGADYVPEFDRERLTGQILRIFELMEDEQFRSLQEIQEATGDPQASISAQLRNLRKERFGSHVINRRRRGDREKGLFEYQLQVNDPEISRCLSCGNKLRPAPANFDGSPTSVGFLPCNCENQ